MATKIKILSGIGSFMVVSVVFAAEITCKQCHAADEIPALIQAREIPIDFSQIPIPEWATVTRLAGEATNVDMANSSNAFSSPSIGLSEAELKLHMQGDTFFEQGFVAAPNTDFPDFSGLGPVFNSNSCESCHQKDGRFNLPSVPAGEKIKLANSGVFFRISIENESTYQGSSGSVKKSAENNWGAPTPVPDYSDQLFHRAASRQLPIRQKTTENDGNAWASIQSGQADVWLSIEKAHTVTYADGTQVALTQPKLWVDNPYDAPDDGRVFNEIAVSADAKSRLFKPDVRLSPRIGAPVFGLGLLEAIDKEDILSRINSDGRSNKGITGKPNWVYDADKHKTCMAANNCEDNPPISLGLYGWKGSTPSVKQQSMGALRGDIGVTNSMFGDEAIAGTALWNALLAADNDFANHVKASKAPESTAKFDEAIVFYAETLAVPAREHTDDPDVIKGAQLFELANCTGCHRPKYVTGSSSKIASFRNQEIYPFTDLLLHDMGEGLADNRQDFEANGREWRTTALWGIGKTKTVNASAGFLHDGRAKTIEEAILWHGGEAESSRQYFRQLSKENRQRLLKFLQSL